MKVVSFLFYMPQISSFDRGCLSAAFLYPKPILSRREKSMIDMKQYGYFETETPPEGLLPGRITELRREQYTVITELGEVMAVLKGAFYHGMEARENFPCVGDFVFLQYNEIGASRIVKLLPRRSKFSRADLSGHAAGYVKTILEQVVATNFDYVFILSSLNWDFKVNRIMRYLTQAWQSGGQPVIILTKADLVEDFDVPSADVRQVAPDVPVHAVSAYTGFGLDALDEYLQPGKTVVFLGMSGVGNHLAEIAELTRVCKSGGWLLDCAGDETPDSDRGEQQDELVKRGWEKMCYIGNGGGNVYRYRKQVWKSEVRS